MKCPTCGNSTRVVDTAPDDMGVYRKRVCTANDEHVFFTVERISNQSQVKLSNLRSTRAIELGKLRELKKWNKSVRGKNNV